MFSFSIYDLIWLLLNTKCLVICSYHTLKVMAILLQSDQQPKPWAWLHAQNSFGEKGHSGNLKQVTLHFNRNLSFKWCTGLQGGEPRGRLVTDPQLLQNGINSRDFPRSSNLNSSRWGWKCLRSEALGRRLKWKWHHFLVSIYFPLKQIGWSLLLRRWWVEHFFFFFSFRSFLLDLPLSFFYIRNLLCNIHPV